MVYKIYAADDDANIRLILASFLTDVGYDVHVFSDGDSLYETFLKQACDLIILDIMMPGTSGITICQTIRQQSYVPIILLTAKDEDMDYMIGINSGADDYIIKPFRPSILMMKIKAILRRVEMQIPENSKEGIMNYGDLSYSVNDHAIFVETNDLALTQTELQLLLFMIKQAGKAVSRETLLEEIWGITTDIESRVTDETVRRIRKKMLSASSRVALTTVWGYGYKLEDMGEI